MNILNITKGGVYSHLYILYVQYVKKTKKLKIKLDIGVNFNWMVGLDMIFPNGSKNVVVC